MPEIIAQKSQMYDKGYYFIQYFIFCWQKSFLICARETPVICALNGKKEKKNFNLRPQIWLKWKNSEKMKNVMLKNPKKKLNLMRNKSSYLTSNQLVFGCTQACKKCLKHWIIT